MQVSDLIARCISKHVNHVFTVSGGADLHLIHSLDKAGVTLVCPQTELCAAYAADAYARIMGLGVAISTSGPGATNLITGIAASYYDSTPVLFVTGNQTRERLKPYGRQYGFQATPIVDIVKPVTKWAVRVDDPKEAVSTLEEAVRIAQEGRKGPVLVDIPDDVQRCAHA
jgi:acetolactate synthase-1/2/3 large subunit